MIDYQGMVREFHVKQLQPVGLGPLTTRVPDAEINLRQELIREETHELFAAMDDDDRALVADALADLLYVVFGTAVVYGMPMDALFTEVHRANMTKDAASARDPGAKYGERGGKGATYEPPRLASILAAAEERATVIDDPDDR